MLLALGGSHAENSRREPIADQDAIRAALCQDEGVVKLATHLATHGSNSLDRIALIAHPKLPTHFIVMEGDRPICALQLLRDPERAPNTVAKKTFSKLKLEGVSIPTNITAVLFARAVAARTWMSVKHEGEQGGIGTVEWDATQKARFNRQGTTGQTRPKNPFKRSPCLITPRLRAY